MRNTKLHLPDRIANALRQEILEGAIPDGELLNEFSLASRFNVSRGPVREALHCLEMEGFARSLSNGRTAASGLSAEDIRYYYDIRYFIESESVKKVLSDPFADDFGEWIEKLEHMLALAQTYIDQSDDARFTELDSEFHLAILTRANVKIYRSIWNLMSHTNSSIMELNRKHVRSRGLHDLSVTYAFHDHILQGLKRRDEEYTLTFLKTHLRNGMSVYAESIEALTRIRRVSDAASRE